MKLCPHPLFLLLSYLQNATCPPFSSDDYYNLDYGGLRNIPRIQRPSRKSVDLHGSHRKYPALTQIRAAREGAETTEEDVQTIQSPVTTSKPKTSTDTTFNNIHINIMVNTAGGKITMTVTNASASTTQVAVPTTETTTTTTSAAATTAQTTPTSAATETPIVSKPVSETGNALPVQLPSTVSAETATAQKFTTTTVGTTIQPPKLETISLESNHPISKPKVPFRPGTGPCTNCAVIVDSDNSFIVPKHPSNKIPNPPPLPWEPEPEDAIKFPAVGFNRPCRSYFDCGFQVGIHKSRTWLRCVENFCTCELLGYVRDDESGWTLSWSEEAEACMSSWGGPCGFSKGLEVHCHLGCECGKENVCEKPGQVWKKPTTPTTTLAPPRKPDIRRPLHRPEDSMYSDEDCDEDEKKQEEKDEGGGDSESVFNVFSFLLFPGMNAVNTILNQSLNSVR